MHEVVTRHLTRMVSENLSLPDLIIVDGGYNQVNVVTKVISDLNLSINVAGLVKDDKHRTSALLSSDDEVISLDNDRDLKLFLTSMQDEVHRFAITYFRKLKGKSMTSSILDSVNGIGDKRKKILLSVYDSLKTLNEATDEELLQYIPLNIIIELRKVLTKHLQE
jgi:excinuclease ABC subunit C